MYTLKPSIYELIKFRFLLTGMAAVEARYNLVTPCSRIILYIEMYTTRICYVWVEHNWIAKALTITGI